MEFVRENFLGILVIIFLALILGGFIYVLLEKVDSLEEDDF